MPSSRPPPTFTQTQPKTYELSVKALLSFPFRLCNPPPSVGKVRSCGVTPLLKVRLEDVLDRKHLPPLGLKDFEEWLLFVEMSPENLYFTLWLKEYKQRYSQWKSQAKFRRNSMKDYPLDWTAQYSSHLAMFYSRAKQTFFTPNSAYELNLPSTMLSPFHQPNSPPYPDPEQFNEVAIETYRMLNESLRRFVGAQLNNVGNKRALCGMIAGTFLIIVGCIPALALSFALGDSRWIRLTALPGLWLGMTILVASLNGVCLGVYIFGDLRQLRKFELSRPSISKPHPLPLYKRSSMPPRPPSAANSILPIQPTRKYSLPTTHPDLQSTTLTRIPSNGSVTSRGSECSNRTGSSGSDIQVSPLYYDTDVDDAPAPFALDDNSDHYGFHPESLSRVEQASTTGSASLRSSFTATASFIPPFLPAGDDEEIEDGLIERSQPMTSFDFDALPKKNRKSVPTPLHLDTFFPPRMPPPPEPTVSRNILVRMQERCTIDRSRLQTGYLESGNSLPPTPTTIAPNDSFSTGVRYNNPKYSLSVRETLVESEDERVNVDAKEQKVKKRFRMMNAVPAFAVPLTRVLSPVVVRGQWEIVVRSALVAFLLTFTLIASLLAVPVVSRR